MSGQRNLHCKITPLPLNIQATIGLFDGHLSNESNLDRTWSAINLSHLPLLLYNVMKIMGQ